MEAQALEPANPFSQAREKYDEVEDMLRADSTRKMTHSEVEDLLETEGRELLRRLFQAHLDLRSMSEDLSVKVVGADEQERTHRRPRRRTSFANSVRMRRNRLDL